MISINKPSIKKNGDYTKLETRVLIDDSEEKLWYEVPSAYAKYLVDEKVDAFLVSVLPYAMASGQEIKIVGAPISEALYWHLTMEFIPTLARFSNYYKKIQIDADITDLSFDAQAVGTGISGGVDSFYTILRNYNTIKERHNVTHLTFFNVGACGYGNLGGGENAEKVFFERAAIFKPIAEHLNLPFVTVNSNTNDFKPMNYNWVHSYKSMGAVLALQKLFGKYYYSSAWPMDMFCLDYHSSAYYDLLGLQCLSTESTKLYSVGLWESRIDKTEFISKYPITYTTLNVCNASATNCGKCDKCIRTMGGLNALGALDKYSEVFPVDEFKNRPVYYYSRIIAKGYDGTVEAKYNREILLKMRENGMRIPFLAFVRAIPGICQGLIIAMAKKNSFITNMVRKKRSKEYGLNYFQ